MSTRPNLKRPGYTATGRQHQTIDALCADGWVILDRGEADALLLGIKRAANLLYNLAQRSTVDVPEVERQAMRDAVEAIDVVTRTLGGNPSTAAIAWGQGQDTPSERRVTMPGNSACYWVADGCGEEYDAWINELLENTPDHYDRDEAAEAIIVGYLRDLEAVRDAAVMVVERMACRHLFDPECPRCEWMLPLRCAMVQAMGWDEDHGPHTGEITQIEWPIREPDNGPWLPLLERGQATTDEERNG